MDSVEKITCENFNDYETNFFVNMWFCSFSLCIIPKTIFRVFQNETGKSNRKNAKTKWCNSAARTQIKTALKYLLNGIQMLFIETDYYSFLS